MDNKPTIKEAVVDNSIVVNYKQMEHDEILMLTYITIISSDEYNSILSELEQSQQSQVFIKRITGLKLEDKIDINLHIYTHVFGMNNPGAIVLLVMELYDFYVRNGRVATKDDVLMYIFPIGYYTKEVCIDIVDKLVKTDIVMSSFIY